MILLYPVITSTITLLHFLRSHMLRQGETHDNEGPTSLQCQ